MSFLKELEAAAHPEQHCKFGRWLIDQTPDYQHEILDALQADYATRLIWRVLTEKHGKFCSASVFERHRAGGCACDIQR